MSLPADLPGAELVEQGLRDLRDDRAHTVPALLVARAAPRLRFAGLAVPTHTVADPDRALYRALEAADPAGAYGAYNALSRRIVSFCDALDHARGR